jgi:hypothetical protein
LNIGWCHRGHVLHHLFFDFLVHAGSMTCAVAKITSWLFFFQGHLIL